MSYIKEWEEARRTKDHTFKLPKSIRDLHTLYIVVIFGNELFPIGTVLKLLEDDNTSSPKFQGSNGITSYCSWYRVKKFIKGK